MEVRNIIFIFNFGANYFIWEYKTCLCLWHQNKKKCWKPLFKISKKGKLFKTFEGQLQLAGSAIMNKESSFEFSVENAEVYNTMQSLEGKNVRLHYKEMIDAFPWQGDTDYMVYRVEEVK